MSVDKVKIKDLPSKESVLETDIFVESDGINTYKVSAKNISTFIVESDTLKNTYIKKSVVGVNGGVVPLNSDNKIDGSYIQYGNTSSTAYEGSAGKILETNLDNHITDEDAHGFNSKLNTLKGTANGLAELDGNGKVPSSQLPSFVDDVLEGNATGVTQDETTGAITATGFVLSGESTECAPESGKIYIDVDTGIQYRWSGTIYVTTGSNIALGETSSTAYRGDRGKIAYDHSQSVHARTDATKVEASSTNGNIKINGTETIVYTHPSGTNPHGTTKSDVGLGNVGDFKAVSTVASQGLTDAEKSNARANIGAGTSSFSGSYNDLTDKPTIPSGEAASKGVDTSISDSSTSTNLPTSKAVASFVENKGYKTTDTNTTYSLSKSGSTIILTGSDGSTTSVTDSSGSSGGGQIVSSTEPSGQNIGDHWLKEF